MPYSESVVTFLDVLGFGEMVSDESQHDRIERVLNRLKEWTRFEGFQELRNQQRFTNFSDCCVRSSPLIKDDGDWNRHGILAHEILDLVHAQLNLIGCESVFLRGAITLGSLHHDNDLVFGPALIRAYYLESKVAKFPRIVLDPRLIQRFKSSIDLDADHHDHDEEVNYVREWVKKDNDGLYYLDYLGLASSELDDEAELVSFLGRHRDLVASGAAKCGDKPDLALKYNWLIEYHNLYVERLTGNELYMHQRSDFFVPLTSAPFYQSLD